MQITNANNNVNKFASTTINDNYIGLGFLFYQRIKLNLT